ncbi:unnamed protein product [Closterium sp. NIES-64]|nr:unnamed protein product [Closterium sp. NIES-64]
MWAAEEEEASVSENGIDCRQWHARIHARAPPAHAARAACATYAFLFLAPHSLCTPSLPTPAIPPPTGIRSAEDLVLLVRVRCEEEGLGQGAWHRQRGEKEERQGAGGTNARSRHEYARSPRSTPHANPSHATCHLLLSLPGPHSPSCSTAPAAPTASPLRCELAHLSPRCHRHHPCRPVAAGRGAGGGGNNNGTENAAARPSVLQLPSVLQRLRWWRWNDPALMPGLGERRRGWPYRHGVAGMAAASHLRLRPPRSCIGLDSASPVDCPALSAYLTTPPSPPYSPTKPNESIPRPPLLSAPALFP